MSRRNGPGPVVSFRLEGLLVPPISETDGAQIQALSAKRCALDGAVNALQAIHKVGGKNIAISSLPRDTALQVVEASSLPIDDVHGDAAHGTKIKRIIGNLKPWAHVSNTNSDARATHSATVQSITIFGNPRDANLIKNARSWGTDQLAPTLQACIGLFNFFSPEGKARYVRPSDAIQQLELTGRRWDKWIQNGLVPQDTDALGHSATPRDFVESLNHYRAGRELTTRQVAFGALVWRAACGDAITRRSAWRELCQKHQVEGTILATKEVANLVGYDRQAVSAWTVRQFIPGFRATPAWEVNHKDWYLREEVEPIRDMLEWFTAVEAAEELAIDQTTIGRHIKSGKLDAHLTPVGYRIDPTVLQHYKDRQQGGLSYAEAKRELDISHKTLTHLIESGVLCLRGDRLNTFGEEEIAVVKAEMERLPIDFAWLQRNVGADWRRSTMASKLLSCGDHTLRRWIETGLLPAANRILPITGQEALYQVPGAYIDAVLAFANGKKVTADLLRTFKQQCCEAKGLPATEPSVPDNAPGN